LSEHALRLLFIVVVEFWKPPRLFLPSERVSQAIVSDDDPGKRRVYIYLMPETADVLSQITGVDILLATGHRLH